MSLQYADNNLCSSSAVFQVSCKVSQQEDGSGVLCNIKNIILLNIIRRTPADILIKLTLTASLLFYKETWDSCKFPHLKQMLQLCI